MSTFDGIVSEFPRIRIDFFRTNPSQPAPLACFLSHVHSDHLQGLDSLKAPFVYCSPATRRLLLRMEKYPHRMNFAKGILEVRKQSYRHLQLILKAIPLGAPTEIELGAKESIRVTLLDANHCPGAVMFLIEGGGKAILYTGDVRAESWWVNSVVRNPVLIPYTLGGKRLDCLYLDTTFATKDDIYHEFSAKATGLQELLQKVGRYPSEKAFYFRAWTLGYEDVWIALSAALRSKIHVDEYQARLYRSLSEVSHGGFGVPEAPALNGFQAGNHIQPGCLTTDSSSVRLHSCEPGTACHARLTKNKDVVWITPIITRSRDGAEVYEIGAGGGGGDLYQTAELDITDSVSMDALADLCVQWIKDPTEVSKALQAISSVQMSQKSKISFDDLGLDSDEGVSLKQLVSRLASFGDQKSAYKHRGGIPGFKVSNGATSSDTIHFPYSRHASYNELRHLVSAFKPKDICPCTVDEETWSMDVSMQSLFGELCSESRFDHDRRLRMRLQDRHDRDVTSGSRKRKREDQQGTQESESSQNAHDIVNGLVEMPAVKVEPPDPVTRTCTGEGGGYIAKTADKKRTIKKATNCAMDQQDSDLDKSARSVASPGNPVHISQLPPVKSVQGPPRIPGNTGGSSFIDLTEDDGPHSPPHSHLQAIQRAFEVKTHCSDMSSSNSPHLLNEALVVQEEKGLSKEESKIQAIRNELEDAVEKVNGEPESQLSLTTSAFESQREPDDTRSQGLLGLQLDGIARDPTEHPRHNGGDGNGLSAIHQSGAEDEDTTRTMPSLAAQKLARINMVKEAYRAARRCLQDGADIGSWEDLSLRCVGRKGHIEEEVEL